MANWQENIDLNGVLAKVGDEFDLSCVEKKCPKPVKDAIVAEIGKSSRLRNYGPLIQRARSIAEVNRILERVYNEADRIGVWCGMGI